MVQVIVIVIAVPFFALVFSGLVLLLGLLWDRFKTHGPGGFKVLYGKFLIVSLVYVLLSMLGVDGLIGLAVMAVTYKYMFGAGWPEALVLGILGGIIGWVAIVGLLVGIAALLA